MAEAFIESFNRHGVQVRPVTASFLATATGKSVASAERFLKKVRDRGYAWKTGREVYFSIGNRGTPMYVLSNNTDAIPEAVQADLMGMVETFPSSWVSPTPAWQ